jgi:hypothetical protein
MTRYPKDGGVGHIAALTEGAAYHVEQGIEYDEANTEEYEKAEELPQPPFEGCAPYIAAFSL